MQTKLVPIEVCDVRDKERLAVYRYFRSRWIEMLNGKDEHAISTQITALLDADLEYRTINFARQLCKEADLPQNGMVHGFIDRGFVAHQAFAIRRVTEDYDGQRRKAVYSLPRIVSEIQEQGELVTREMYVCVDGDPYDPADSGMNSFLRHKNFDGLSKIEVGSRSRDDRIHVDCYRDLRRKFISSNPVRDYANRLLAHAADPLTRKGSEGFTLEDLDAIYKDLIWTTNHLSATVLYDTGHVFLPSYTFDNLQHIDNALCPPAHRDRLREFWSARYKELEELERGA